MQLNNFEIIRYPILTEKSNLQKDTQNKVTFLVHSKANKIQIKSAVEAIFNVSVEKVNIQCRKGKRKRFGRHEGKRPDTKKAVVTLKEGHKIEIFEGV
ncbi:MAG: 50S ribosomal protein L23 [Candidatus Schekmanbacteria bacterium]|nr:MAG: 50S ribosomal protein L23 [Candidatus Schekmanbacteria bacterium]